VSLYGASRVVRALSWLFALLPPRWREAFQAAFVAVLRWLRLTTKVSPVPPEAISDNIPDSPNSIGVLQDERKTVKKRPSPASAVAESIVGHENERKTSSDSPRFGHLLARSASEPKLTKPVADAHNEANLHERSAKTFVLRSGATDDSLQSAVPSASHRRWETESPLDAPSPQHQATHADAPSKHTARLVARDVSSSELISDIRSGAVAKSVLAPTTPAPATAERTSNINMPGHGKERTENDVQTLSDDDRRECRFPKDAGAREHSTFEPNTAPVAGTISDARRARGDPRSSRSAVKLKGATLHSPLFRSNESHSQAFARLRYEIGAVFDGAMESQFPNETKSSRTERVGQAERNICATTNEVSRSISLIFEGFHRGLSGVGPEYEPSDTVLTPPRVGHSALALKSLTGLPNSGQTGVKGTIGFAVKQEKPSVDRWLGRSERPRPVNDPAFANSDLELVETLDMPVGPYTRISSVIMTSDKYPNVRLQDDWPPRTLFVREWFEASPSGASSPSTEALLDDWFETWIGNR
jgi:hypothetical protein